MNVVVSIPDEIATRLNANGTDLGRQVLEALVLENVRAGRMTRDDGREALGFEVLDQVDAFLKARGVWEDQSIQHDRQQAEAPDVSDAGTVDQDRINLAEVIRRRFATVGGVDDLVIPPRAPMREPPRFDR